jgi:DNA processing protein
MNTLEGSSWRALAGAKGAGPKTLWMIADYLSNHKKTASWLLQNPNEIKAAIKGNKAGIVLPDFADREYEEIEKFAGQSVTVLHPLHPDFPQWIRTLKDKISLPALLYVTGNIAILNRPAVAIVGKRQAGKAALTLAALLACKLAAKGINITSGYAAGIDTAAHLAALSGGGTTSVVLSEGIHHFQAKLELRKFLTKENTLVISQFEPYANWASYSAMARNKLVCALSSAVVVIHSGPEREANGKMSGTFNAGLAALKLGIPIFVVTPDFFPDPPAGNRQLIAKGSRAWDPAAGIAPILAAIKSHADQKLPPRQLDLFGRKED